MMDTPICVVEHDGEQLFQFGEGDSAVLFDELHAGLFNDNTPNVMITLNGTSFASYRVEKRTQHSLSGPSRTLPEFKKNKGPGLKARAKAHRLKPKFKRHMHHFKPKQFRVGDQITITVSNQDFLAFLNSGYRNARYHREFAQMSMAAGDGGDALHPEDLAALRDRVLSEEPDVLRFVA